MLRWHLALFLAGAAGCAALALPASRVGPHVRASCAPSMLAPSDAAQPLGRRSAVALVGGAVLGLGAGAVPAARAESQTASGLQYRVVRSGTGGGKPIVGDLCAARIEPS